MPAHRFVWYELVTSDIDAALAFYGTLLGWKPQEFAGGDGRYVTVSADGKGVGGVMALPNGITQPFWMGYVGVDDADACIAALEGAGAAIHRRMDIPDVGRIALATDRQGAGFAVIEPAGEGPSAAFDPNAPSHGAWHELHTTNADDAWDFYAGQFGWTKDMAMPMGPVGTYQIFAIEGVQAGAMFNDTNVPRPMWLFYFGTADLDAAIRTVTENGGKILFGPQEVPGGRVIANVLDPQGALFALVAPKVGNAQGGA